MLSFTIKNRDTSTYARTGVMKFAPKGRGVAKTQMVKTPVFMPVGTYGAVKTLSPNELRAVGSEIILGNTFHLHLRPGEDTVKKLGGLAAFNAWHGPTLTDSGGFQVFSLKNHRKITDEGVFFKSPLDGSSHAFTPKNVMDIQAKLGSSIAMQIDECVAGTASYEEARKAMERTHAWAGECVAFHKKYDKVQALFPIIQGAHYPDLRTDSAQFMRSLNTPGVAIGGLAVGESKEQFYNTLELLAPLLDPTKPHYLMGVGEPSDIVYAAACGVDMFDCVHPTRIARHGQFFLDIYGNRTNIKRAEFTLDKKPLTPDTHELCLPYSRAYLRHLFQTDEALVLRILSLHNLHMMFRLLSAIRTAIEKGEYAAFAKAYAKKAYLPTK